MGVRVTEGDLRCVEPEVCGRKAPCLCLGPDLPCSDSSVIAGVFSVLTWRWFREPPGKWDSSLDARMACPPPPLPVQFLQCSLPHLCHEGRDAALLGKRTW